MEFLSDQELEWRDNLWIMHNSLLICPCKDWEENKKGLVTVLQQRQGFGFTSKDAQRCSAPTAPSCSWNSLARGHCSRNLGTLSPALTSSTYVVFKRHFKTKGWAKNLGEAFDHSQHGRSYVAFPVSAVAGNTAMLLPLYVFISKETYAQNSNERIHTLHWLGSL